MDLEWAYELFGETGAAAAAGVIVGGLFGVSAQRSRFCLRAAAVEFARGGLGERMAIWLLCFSTALFWTQLFRLNDAVDLHNARVLSGAGSVSGAIIGGLMFGAGMILARGCSGRLLVLAAGGNLRSLLTGLVFVVAAQTAYHGALAPLRDRIAGAWTVGPPNIELSAALGFGTAGGVALGAGFAALALFIAWRAKVSLRALVFGSGVGFAVGTGWWITTQLSRSAFEPTPVESLTFSGPSADALMVLLAQGGVIDFGVGMIAGVFGGALLAALLAGEAKFEGFDGAPAMRRHIVGGVLMGFGAMLAGGCAIGAGVTGTSALSATHWLALLCIWIGAVATDFVADRPRQGAAQAV
jgi:uncharacterized membrane protein YedE/YeeE